MSMSSEAETETIKHVEAMLEKSYGVPTIKDVRWNRPLESGLIEAVWSQASVASGKTIQFTTFQSSADPNAKTSVIPMGSESEIIGRKGAVKVTIGKTKNDKGDEIQVLHHFSDNRLVRSINLTDLDLHGQVGQGLSTQVAIGVGRWVIFLYC